MREIRNLYRFIPFGKFSLSGRGKPPFNQVYVGRQKERATFIELLTHQESFGAFLVSGQRGAGKTSFVRYCLDEYNRMAFQRSIRISRNSTIYGVLFLLAFCVFAVSAFILLTQALELGAQNVFEAILAMNVGDVSGIRNFASASVVWWIVPFILGTFLMLMPAIFAFRVPSAIAMLQDTKGRVRQSYFFSVVGIFLLPCFWIVTAQFDINIKLDNLLYGLLWLVIPLFGMVQLMQSLSTNINLPRKVAKYLTRFAITLASISYAISMLNLPGDEHGADLSDLVLMTLIYGSLGFGGKFWSKKQRDMTYCQLSIFVFYGSLSVFLFVPLEFGPPNATGNAQDFGEQTSSFLIPFFQISPAILFVLILRWVLFRFRNMGKTEEDQSIPPGPFKFILVIKSSLLLILTLVGIAPAIRVVLGWSYLHFSNESAWLMSFVPNLASTHATVVTAAIIVMLVIAIYACEYAWICRDLRSHRQDATITMLGRSSNHPIYQGAWDDKRAGEAQRTEGSSDEYIPKPRTSIAEPRLPFLNSRLDKYSNPMEKNPKFDETEAYTHTKLSSRRRFVFRQIESATLPHLVYSVRHPVIPVWVNLGFDNLEHSRIIEAMLRRLRGLYKDKFLSLRSTVGILNALLLLAATVLFTSVVSKSVFHIGHIAAIDRKDDFKYRFETAEGGIRPIFGETNYCGFFEVYPEVSPNIKSLVCALPFNNAIMELLYSPVLQIHTDFSSNIASRNSSLNTPISKKHNFLSGCASNSPDLTKPLVYVNWSNCLSSLAVDQNTDSAAIPSLEAADPLREQFVATRKDFFTKTNGLNSWGEKILNRIGLERFVIATPIVTEDDLSLIRDSELVHYVLDQNYGLPRIDFTTPNRVRESQSLNSEDRMRVWYSAYSTLNRGEPGTPTLRAYHLLLYVLGFWMFFSINRRLGSFTISSKARQY